MQRWCRLLIRSGEEHRDRWKDINARGFQQEPLQIGVTKHGQNIESLLHQTPLQEVRGQLAGKVSDPTIKSTHQ